MPLTGDELSAELEQFQASLGAVIATVEGELRERTRDGAFVSDLFRDLVELMQQGKLVALSVQDAEAQQVMYAQLEELANLAAAMVFALRDFNADAATDEDLLNSCSLVVRQFRQLAQLAMSQAALMAVDCFDVPSAEAVLAEAHAQLEREWREGPCEPRAAPPDPAPLQAVKLAARDATCEWAWGDFVRDTAAALRHVRASMLAVQDAGKRVLLQQAAELMLGRAKQLLTKTAQSLGEDAAQACRAAVTALTESVDALLRVCEALDAKAFRPLRTPDSCPEAATLQAALVEGVSASPRERDLFPRIKAVQDAIPPLSQELRAFKANPDKFSLAAYVALLGRILADTGFVCAGLSDEPTRNLLQGLREQLADAATGFVYAALDVRDYASDDSTQDGLLALRKLSLVLVQLAKWAAKAVAALQPARTVAADPDASRIMKRLAALREGEPCSPRAQPRSGNASDLAPVRGLVTGLTDALRLAERALADHDDTANISDAIVHVVLQVGSLARHFDDDVHVAQLCALTELLGHSSFDVIFRIRDLGLPVGDERLVQAAAGAALEQCGRMKEKLAVFSAKVARLAELYQVIEALESLEALLGGELPQPPRASNAAALEQALRRESVAVTTQCQRAAEDHPVLGAAVLATANVVRHSVTVLSDGADVARIVRVTATMLSSCAKALQELAGAASFDPSSERFAAAQIRAKVSFFAAACWARSDR